MRTYLALAVLLVVCMILMAAGKGGGEATEQDKVLAKLEVFPKDDEWNRDISMEPVDPKSDALVAEIGAAMGWNVKRVYNELFKARRSLVEWQARRAKDEER